MKKIRQWEVIETARGVIILYRLVRKGLSKKRTGTSMMRKNQRNKGLGDEYFGWETVNVKAWR